MDIGSLTGTVGIEDQLTSTLEIAAHHVKSFAEDFDGAMGGLAIGAGLAATAIIGTIVSITALGEEGSKILGVEHAFDHLAEAAGTTGHALRESLSEGVRGTVGELQLMESTSKLLGAGMKLTTDQASLMGSAARELGKATGGDATSGLDMLSSALTTGRVRGLQQQIGLIDLAAGEKKFAESIGTTVDQLNAAGLLEGKRIAIFEATQAYLERLGTSELSFAEKVKRGWVAVEEWGVSLAKAVASSPNVMAALDAISGAISKAFGGDSEKMLTMIVGWVNSFADAVTKYGPPIIQTIADIWHAAGDLIEKIRSGWDLVPDWFKNIARDAALAAGATYLVSSAFSSFGVSSLSTLANVAQIWSVMPAAVTRVVPAVTALTEAVGLLGVAMTSLVTGGAILGIAAIGTAAYQAFQLWSEKSVRASSDTQQLALDVTNLARINASLGTSFTTIDQATKEVTRRNLELAAAHDFVGPKISDTEARLRALNGGLDENGRFLKDRTEALRKWADTMDGLRQKTLTAEIENNLTGLALQKAKLDQQEAAEIQSFQKMFTAHTINAKQLGEATNEINERYRQININNQAKALQTELTQLREMWTETENIVQSYSGTAYQIASKNIDDWKATTIAAHKIAGTDTVQFYASLDILETAKRNQLEQNTAAADKTSQQYYLQEAARGRAMYAEAASGSTRASDTQIANLKTQADALTIAANNWKPYSAAGVAATSQVTAAITTTTGAVATLSAVTATASGQQVAATMSVTQAYYAELDALIALAAAQGVLITTVGKRPLGIGDPGFSSSTSSGGMHPLSGATAPIVYTPPLGYDIGGPVAKTGPAIVHSGEYVIPENGALVSKGGGGDTIIVQTLLGTIEQLTAAVSAAQLARTGRKFTRG